MRLRRRMSKRLSSLAGKLAHRRIWPAARGMIVLATALALIVAPLVVIATHGPAAHADAASMTAQVADDIAAHGHSHDHGHRHDEAGYGQKGGSFAGHNPADHDHQLQALVCRTAHTTAPMHDKAQCSASDVLRNLAPEGPMRPPRFV